MDGLGSIDVARAGTGGWHRRAGDFLTRDRPSRLDPYVTWVRHPIAVLGLATAGSALSGLFLHPQGFVLTLGLAAALVLGLTWPWLGLRGVDGSLGFATSRAREGEPVGVVLTVRNRAPWGVWGLTVRGGLSDVDGSAEGTTVGLTHLGGWSAASESMTFTPTRRGVYPVASPRIATGFPFGLRTSSRPLVVPAPLLVWPRTFPVGPIPRTAGGRSFDGAAVRSRAGHSGDVLGVRPYRRGDPIRQVHWPQTARSGDLIVSESHEAAVPRVQVVVDTHPGSHAGVGPDGSREWAIRIAASFIEDWIAQGADLEAVFGDRALGPGGGTVRARQARFLDALTRVDEGDHLGLAGLLDLPTCRSFGRGLRIVVATDAALARIGPPGSSRVTERYVVLDASAFSGDGADTDRAELPIRPWVMLDDPASVPRRLRESWKEVSLGS